MRLIRFASSNWLSNTLRVVADSRWLTMERAITGEKSRPP